MVDQAGPSEPGRGPRVDGFAAIVCRPGTDSRRRSEWSLGPGRRIRAGRAAGLEMAAGRVSPRAPREYIPLSREAPGLGLHRPDIAKTAGPIFLPPVGQA